MKQVNREQFEEIIKEGITLVDVFADWCGPCKMIAPIVEKIEIENPTINVIKVDADQEGKMMMTYSVGSIPTLLFFKDGILEKSLVGFQPQSKIQAVLNQIMN
jgi:thioredoxin 1